MANTARHLRDGLKLTPGDRALLLAAALPRHGARRFLPRADDGPGHGRLPGDAGFRPPPGAVAEAHVATTASTISYRAELRLRPRGAAHQRRRGRRSICRAVRVAGIGGDMVRPDVLRLFAEKLSAREVRSPRPSCRATAWPRRRWPSPSRDSGRRPSASIRVEPHALQACAARSADARRRSVEIARASSSAAVPLPGHAVMSATTRATPLGERAIGRIYVKGPSLMAGYYNNGKPPPT